MMWLEGRWPKKARNTATPSPTSMRRYRGTCGTRSTPTARERRQVRHCIGLILVSLLAQGETAYSRGSGHYTENGTPNYTKAHMLRAVELAVETGYAVKAKTGYWNPAFEGDCRRQGTRARVHRHRRGRLPPRQPWQMPCGGSAVPIGYCNGRGREHIRLVYANDDNDDVDWPAAAR